MRQLFPASYRSLSLTVQACLYWSHPLANLLFRTAENGACTANCTPFLQWKHSQSSAVAVWQHGSTSLCSSQLSIWLRGVAAVRTRSLPKMCRHWKRKCQQTVSVYRFFLISCRPPRTPVTPCFNKIYDKYKIEPSAKFYVCSDVPYTHTRTLAQTWLVLSNCDVECIERAKQTPLNPDQRRSWSWELTLLFRVPNRCQISCRSYHRHHSQCKLPMAPMKFELRYRKINWTWSLPQSQIAPTVPEWWKSLKPLRNDCWKTARWFVG